MRIYNDLLKKRKTRPCEVCKKSLRRHEWADMNMLGVVFYCSNKDAELAKEQQEQQLGSEHSSTVETVEEPTSVDV